MFHWLRNLIFKPEPEPKPARCRIDDTDCFGDALEDCPRGYCMVHCPCFCRGSHAKPPPRTA